MQTETPSIFPQQVEKIEKEKSTNQTVRKESFTEEELQAAWQSFVKESAATGKVNSMVLKKKITKHEGEKVCLHFSSDLELPLFHPIETQLVQYLRNHLNNDNLTIHKHIHTSSSPKIPYTSKEILDFMIKKNPNLQDLIEKLDLDYS